MFELTVAKTGRWIGISIIGYLFLLFIPIPTSFFKLNLFNKSMSDFLPVPLMLLIMQDIYRGFTSPSLYFQIYVQWQIQELWKGVSNGSRSQMLRSEGTAPPAAEEVIIFIDIQTNEKFNIFL